jgi:hypothetical protein
VFQIKLSDIQAAGACRTTWFHSHADEGADAIEYPNGWQQGDTDKLAEEYPITLMFFSLKKIIPVNFIQVAQAIKKAHGDDKFKAIDADFKNHADANK